MKLILIILFSTTTMVSAKESKPVYLCGRQLADARLALCYGMPYVDKRTTLVTMIDQFNQELWNDGYHVWGGRRGSLSADRMRYKRTGLADECCLKPCVTDVILTYC